MCEAFGVQYTVSLQTTLAIIVQNSEHPKCPETKNFCSQTRYMPICSLFTPLGVHIHHFAEILLDYVVLAYWVLHNRGHTPDPLHSGTQFTLHLCSVSPYTIVLPRSSEHHHPNPPENIA